MKTTESPIYPAEEENAEFDPRPFVSDSDIPAGVDAFLRELARWTVENIQKTAVRDHGISKSRECSDDKADERPGTLLNKIS